MPHLQCLKLTQPVTFRKNFTISLLIGTDFYWSLVEHHRGYGLTAQQSNLGYLLSGPMPTTLSEYARSALLQNTSTMTMEKPMVTNVEQFWSIKAVGTEADTLHSDLTFLQCYQQSRQAKVFMLQSFHGK